MTLYPTPSLGSNCVGRDFRSGFEANQRLALFALEPSGVSSAHVRNVLDDKSRRTHLPDVIMAFVSSVPVSALGFPRGSLRLGPRPSSHSTSEHPNTGPSKEEGDEKLLRC